MNAARAWPRSSASTKCPAAASSAFARSSGRRRPRSVPRPPAAGRRRGPAGRGSTARSPAGAGSPIRRRARRRGPRGPARCPGRRSRWPAGRRRPAGPRSPRSPRYCRERVGQHGQRLRQRAVLLAVQAAGQRQRADQPVADPLGVRVGRGQVAARRADLAAVEADHGGDAEIAAGRGGFLQVLGQGLHLGQRVVPPPGLEQQLAQGAVRLSQPDRRADLVGQVPGLPGRGQRLLVPVEVAQRDGLVDLQQQPQVGQRRIGLRSRPAPGRTAAARRPCRPRTAVTSASTSSAQPMAQLSPASVAAASALGGDPARRSRPRRGCCASAPRAPAAGRGAGPRSRARPAPGPAWPATPRTRPASIRHCASVQCRSTSRSGSVACSSARLATCSAAARSPMRYRASASRLASQPCRAEPAGSWRRPG